MPPFKLIYVIFCHKNFWIIKYFNLLSLGFVWGYRKFSLSGNPLKIMIILLIIVQLLSCVRFFVTPRTAACQASLSFTISGSLLKLMSIESVIPSNLLIISSCLQSFPASGSILMSRLFTSDSQSIGASVSAWILPMDIQDWFPLGLTGWISLLSKGLSTGFSNTTISDFIFTTRHIHTWLLEKP